MNYIKKLQDETANLKLKVDFLENELSLFRSFLSENPKFRGSDLDGSRKDWISTGDVIAWIEQVKTDSFRME